MKYALVLVALVALAAACSKQQEAPPEQKPAITEVEIKRGEDACKTYVAKVCACAETVAAVKEQCQLAKALPEVIEVSMQVAMNPDSKRLDTLQAADSIRKTVAECIQQTAKLPASGCP